MTAALQTGHLAKAVTLTSRDETDAYCSVAQKVALWLRSIGKAEAIAGRRAPLQCAHDEEKCPCLRPLLVERLFRSILSAHLV